jgi:hypothetical protein
MVVIASTYSEVPAAGTVSPQTAPTNVPTRSFVVYDATLYKNKPELRAYGVNPIKIFYEWDLWARWGNKDLQDLPRRNDVARAAYEARNIGSLAIIDIEHWPLKDLESVVQGSLRQYRTVLAWFREALPATRFGFYGAPPIVDYWRAVSDPSSDKHRSWIRDNARIASLSQDVDALFPSAYTFYSDKAGWKKYAVAQISAARAYNKPVYVFLWPQYHESNRLLGGRYLTGDYWRMELHTALEHADGVVIWGGWRQQWNESAPWWQVTKEFMRELKTSGLSQ